MMDVTRNNYESVVPFSIALFGVFAHVLDSQLFEFVSISVPSSHQFVILIRKGKIFKLSTILTLVFLNKIIDSPDSFS